MNKTARLLATTLIAGAFFLWAQPDDTVSFPKEFRKWAHVKSVLVGPQSAAFATEGGIHHIYANGNQNQSNPEGGYAPHGSEILLEESLNWDSEGDFPESGKTAKNLAISESCGVADEFLRTTSELVDM